MAQKALRRLSQDWLFAYWCARQDSNLHCAPSEGAASCRWATGAQQLVIGGDAPPYRRKSRRPPGHRPSILSLLTIKPTHGRVIFGSVKLTYLPTSLVAPSRRA